MPPASGKIDRLLTGYRGPQTFVTIITGSEGNTETFSILKNVICHHSPFFDAAFNSQLLEGQTQSMTLEDVDSEIFALLVDWLYLQTVRHSDEEFIHPVILSKLWVLGERFLMPRLQNDVMRIFQSPDFDKDMSSEEAYDPAGYIDFVKYIFNTPGEKAPLKELWLKAALATFNTGRKHKCIRSWLPSVLVNREAALYLVEALVDAYENVPVPAARMHGDEGLMVEE